MKKLLLSAMFGLFALSANAQELPDIVGSCVDMEYYDDVMHYDSTIEILGYIITDKTLYDRLGNPNVADVIRSNGRIYTADFNVYENTVCVKKLKKGMNLEVYSYHEKNPWE